MSLLSLAVSYFWDSFFSFGIYSDRISKHTLANTPYPLRWDKKIFHRTTTAATAHIHRRTCLFLEKRLETSKNSYKTASRSKNDYKRRHRFAVIWLWDPVSNGKSD